MLTEWSPLPILQQAAQLPHPHSDDLTHLKCSKYEPGTQPARISREPGRSWAGFSLGSGNQRAVQLVIIPGLEQLPRNGVFSVEWSWEVPVWTHVRAHTWKLLTSSNAHGFSSLRRVTDYKLVKLDPISLAGHPQDADTQNRMANIPCREAKDTWSHNLEAEA